jgi:hypothetical protein
VSPSLAGGADHAVTTAPLIKRLEITAAAVVLKIFIFLPFARLILRVFPIEHWCGMDSSLALDRQTPNIIPTGSEPLSAWTNLDEARIRRG